jgi:hypothetical protein
VPRHQAGREPWYYKALGLLAIAILLCGTAVFVAALIVAAIAVRSGSRDVAALAPPLAYYGGAFLGTVLTSAPVFLLLDVARNVRRDRMTLCP